MTTTAHFTIFLILSLSSLSNTAFSERCHPNDKKALREIKKSLNANNPNLIKWDLSIDCCESRVVECDDKTNRVTVFVLQITDLNCPFPTAVADLEHLGKLYFHKTNLTGEIPQVITKLSRLEWLDLSWNHLSGNIPSFLGQLKQLNYISLSFNNFTGSIPASLSQLPNLDGLFLDRNRLTGEIPESFAEFKQQNFYLHLSHNQLSGEIPRKLGHANFTWIDVSRNRLEGDISFFFGKNKSIMYADFSRNMFRFDMSEVEFPMSLTNVDFNHNAITGRLPEGLVDLYLNSLNVSYNRMCGKIPVGGRLQELFDYTAYFHNRCLCGAPLPECK